MKIALLLVGLGHVGRRFVQLLNESRVRLTALGIEPTVVGIVTERHGGIFDRAGLDAVRIAQARAEGDAIGPASPPSVLEYLAQLRSQSIETRVMIETTTLDIQSGDPAVAHVRAALGAGIDVITANKGPAAFAYRALQREADANGASFLFKAAVMDGVPVFNL